MTYSELIEGKVPSHDDSWENVFSFEKSQGISSGKIAAFSMRQHRGFSTERKVFSTGNGFTKESLVQAFQFIPPTFPPQ